MNHIYLIVNNAKNNKRLAQSAIATIIMFLIAHGYSYFNSAFCMDRYAWFDNGWFGGYYWRDGTYSNTGKWFNMYYGLLNDSSYLPWFNGILTILFSVGAVFIICDALDINQNLNIWMVAGLVATNISIITAHFYFPFPYLGALFLAVLSVLIWDKEYIKMWVRILSGAVCICLSLGTYGAYTSVGPTLVILCCILLILKDTPGGLVLKRGAEYIFTFLVGLILYYVILRIYLVILNIDMLAYMNEDRLMNGIGIQELLYLLEIAYKNAILYYLGDYRGSYVVMPRWMAIMALVLILVLFVLAVIQRKKMDIRKGEFWILSILLVLFPLSAASIYVMSFGAVHQLMIFTYVIFYIGALKLIENTSDQGKICSVIGVMLSLVLAFVVYRGVLTSNMAYSRLDNLYTISNGIAERLIERVESCEGFEGNETICFYGDITDSYYFTQSREQYSWNLEQLDGVLGVDRKYSNTFLYPTHLIMLLRENSDLNLDIEYFDPDDNSFTMDQMQQLKDMPVYPADGSTKKIDDIIMVKFVEFEERDG